MKKIIIIVLFTHSHQCFKHVLQFYSIKNKEKMLNKCTKNKKKLVNRYTPLQLMGTRAFKPQKNAMLQKLKHKVIIKLVKHITLMHYISNILSDF